MVCQMSVCKWGVLSLLSLEAKDYTSENCDL